MQVEIKIDPSCQKPKVIILTDKMTDEVINLARKLTAETPRMIAGVKTGAVLVQAVLCGLIGSFCAAGSVIWEIESWSIARQTGTFFILILLFETFVSLLAGWIPDWHSLILNYVIFIVIFILIWGIRCRIWKSRIKKINARLKLDPKD